MATMIGAVRLEKVWESRLRTNFVSLTGEEAPRDKSDLAKAMEVHFAKTCAAEKLSQCDQCMGWSDEAASESCPYCGDSPPAEGVTAANEDPTVIDAAAMEAAGVELVEEEPRKKGKQAARKAPPVPKPSAPLVMITGGKIIASEHELDAAMDEIRDQMQKGNESWYRVGIIARDVKERLWQQRTDKADGKPKYKSWAQFCESEFDKSQTFVNRLIATVETFNEKVFASYGIKALMLMCTAPKAEHAQLMAKVDAGMPVRELETEIKGIRKEQGIAVMPPSVSEVIEGRTAKATEAAAAKRKKESAAITLGLKEKNFEAKLFTAASIKSDDPRRAREVADKPCAKIECMNGVVMYVALVASSSGELKLKFVTKRQDEE